MSFDFDATVVGAGAVGLACGRALAARGLSVLVLEKEGAIGQGVSSRNSEVIHGGLYYPTGSLKARFCVEGRCALYAFLESHKVEHWKCGKLIVATEPDEVERLDAILDQAVANDVEGVQRLTATQALAMEPELRVQAALLSSESGVFDSHGYMLALQGEIEDAGGSVVVSTPFQRAEPLPGGGFRITAGGAALLLLELLDAALQEVELRLQVLDRLGSGRNGGEEGDGAAGQQEDQRSRACAVRPTQAHLGGSASTMKSVPRMPTVALVVSTLTASGCALPRSPVIMRSEPRSSDTSMPFRINWLRVTPVRMPS